MNNKKSMPIVSEMSRAAKGFIATIYRKKTEKVITHSVLKFQWLSSRQ